jgi:hypothetical protein
LAGLFQKCVSGAIEQEIAVQDRAALAVALGRLGDPRIEADLRLTVHPDGSCPFCALGRIALSSSMNSELARAAALRLGLAERER